MGEETEKCRHVHIVMGGRNDEHIAIGLRDLDCDSVHVITSKDLEEGYLSRIQEISEESGAAKGLVIGIPTEELFSEGSAQAIRDAVNRICEHEGYHFPLLEGHKKELSPLSGEHCRFMVNITGGTNLMAGAAVHISSIIGATPYYIAEGDDGQGSKVVTLPSMTIMSLLSKFDQAPMSELLERPTGDVSDLSIGTDLVLELTSLGYATMQGNGPHYEISEEVKGILWQTVQVRLSAKGRSGDKKLRDIRERLDRLSNKGKKKDEDYVSTLISLGPESCKNIGFRIFMETNDLEARAEIWEGPRGTRLRIYHATAGEDHGGKPSERTKDTQFRERWYDRNEAISVLLSGAEFPPNAAGKEGGAIASAISSDNDMVILSFVARKKLQWLYFDVPGGLDSPSSA